MEPIVYRSVKSRERKGEGGREMKEEEGEGQIPPDAALSSLPSTYLCMKHIRRGKEQKRG